jgi:hypothetical protein
MRELGGVDTFRLYVEILLHKNWRHELLVTPKLLLSQLKRSKQYWDKQLKSQLQSLIDNGIIEADAKIDCMGMNDYLHIKVLLLEGATTEVKCMNDAIFDLHTTVSVNILFAIFVSIKMCVDKDVQFARVAKETIEARTGIEVKTVGKAINVLEDNGYLGIRRGIYNKDKKKKETNRYYVYDYNSLFWKVRHGLASLPEKQLLSGREEAETEIEKVIAEVMSSPRKFSPCVFEGLPAKLFYEYYQTFDYGNLFTISTLAEMSGFVNKYEGILDEPLGGVIIIHFERLTDGLENYLVAFVNRSTIPIILLLGDGVEITNNKLKSLRRYIYS